jgi:hypothetical protein
VGIGENEVGFGDLAALGLVVQVEVVPDGEGEIELGDEEGRLPDGAAGAGDAVPDVTVVEVGFGAPREFGGGGGRVLGE